MFLNQREEPLATMEINAGVKTLARSSSGRLRRGSFVCTPPHPSLASSLTTPVAPSWSCVCTTASFWPCRSLGNPRHTLHTIHTTHYTLRTISGMAGKYKKKSKKKISLIKKKKKCCFCIFPVFLDLTAGPNFKCRKSKTSC